MVIPVVQHNRPQHLDSRPAEDLSLPERETPRSLRGFLRHVAQVLLHVPDAFRKGGVNLLEIFRWRGHEIALRDVKLIFPRKVRQRPREPSQCGSRVDPPTLTSDAVSTTACPPEVCPTP